MRNSAVAGPRQDLAAFDCDVIVVGGGPGGSTAAAWIVRGARSGDHRRLGPWFATLTQVRSAGRRPASRQYRRLFALLRYSATARSARRRHSHHRASRSRLVLANPDFG